MKQYSLEAIVSPTTTKANNFAFADLDLFVVKILQQHGLEVKTILTRELVGRTKTAWYKSPHK